MISYWTYVKIIVLTWSIVDIVLMFFFIKLMNLTRTIVHKKPHNWLFLLLLISFIFLPFWFIVKEFSSFLFIEIIVYDIWYFIILFLLIKNWKILSNAPLLLKHLF